MGPMSTPEVSVDGAVVEPAEGWTFAWVERGAGIARLSRDGTSVRVLVEGSGEEWIVTLGGRRIGLRVRTWRERALEAVEAASAHPHGPLEVRASLPGLVVGVPVEVGAAVEAGEPLVTLEAMKMQNLVRAPRAGRVSLVAVRPGQVVAAGAVLITLE
jgi:acetyl/propionyl-CoA carboxylase alpha subunit